jgi:membrane peptidoglycan carboxypeptidase
MVRALGKKIRGTREAPPLSLALVRRLRPDDGGFRALFDSWFAARRMERDLSRQDILAIYLNQVPFGAGRFGIEEGARAMFDKPAAALDAKQAQALAAQADRDDGSPPPPRKFTAAPGCGKAAAADLSSRFDAAALARMGSVVVTTTCDPVLSRAVEQIVAKQDLARTGLSAAVVVLHLPSHEVSALVGDPSISRPLGNLRVPLIFAAALGSLKFTPISPVNNHGTTLRAMAGMSPPAAANALLGAGLAAESVRDLATKIGLRSTVEPVALAQGTAPISLLDAVSILATFIDSGQLRQPQLIHTINGQPETDAARLLVKAMTPDVAYLSLSLSSSESAPATAPRKPAKDAPPLLHGTDAWTALGMPDAVLMVWVGYPDGHTLPANGDGERASVAIAHGVLGVLLHGRPQPLLPRPPTLVERRLDGNGRLLPSSARSGTVEWFVPGSLPREDTITREPDQWPTEKHDTPPAAPGAPPTP